MGLDELMLAQTVSCQQTPVLGQQATEAGPEQPKGDLNALSPNNTQPSVILFKLPNVVASKQCICADMLATVHICLW